MALYIGIKNLIGKGAAWLRSKWTTIVTQLKATFRYRVAGGSDNALLPESNGRAVFDKIYGNTVKWNQNIRYDLGDTQYWKEPTINGLKSYYFSGGILRLTKNNSISYGGGWYYNKELDTSHTYYYAATVRTGNSNYEAVVSLINSTDNPSRQADRFVECFSTTFTRVSKIVKTQVSTGKFALIAGRSSSPEDAYGEFKDVIFIDLTDIFGTDAEIAAALGISVADITTDVGTAAFEAWLALNVGEQDYYPYDEGSLISFKGQGVRTLKNNVELDRLELDVTKVYGKINGEGSRYQCYPNGMRSAGSVSDELSVEQAVAAIGSRAYQSGDESDSTVVTDGTTTYYPLTTPITYTDLIYSEDGGVTGVPLKDLAYKVDKYSTEELLVPASVAGEPTSTAIVADIEYQAR